MVGMIKVITPGSQDLHGPVAQLIKMSRQGLRGDDLSQFIKRAGHELAAKVLHLTFKSGEQPIHLLAVGTTEDYGPNRNGDGFRRLVIDVPYRHRGAVRRKALARRLTDALA